MSRSLPKSSVSLVIRMLGSFAILADGRRIPDARFGSRKAWTLLRWLADARNDTVPEDVLLDALWPDTPPADAVRSLRVRVSELRRGLTSFLPEVETGPLLERADNGYLLRTVPGRLETDVDAFTAAATAGLQAARPREALPELERAVALYSGDYFSDDPYTEQWHPAREQYRQQFVAVTSRLAAVYESKGRYDDGIRLLKGLLARPVREERQYRALMRLLYLHGDQAGALRVFDECRDYLRDEFGAQPLPKTLELMKRILRREPLAKADSSSPALEPKSGPKLLDKPKWPFFGRKTELALLQSEIRDLADGRGGVVWLHGPTGIGKTRLLQEALAARGAFDGRRLFVRGSSLNAGIPFAAALDGLQTGLTPALSLAESEQMLAPSGQLRPLLGLDPTEVGAPGEDAEPFRHVHLRQEFLRFFEDLTVARPLILMLEKVDALDSATRALLGALARRTDKWPLLIIVSSRRAPEDSDVGAELLSLDRACTVVFLEPLAPSDLRARLADGVPDASIDRWLRQLHAATGGEPFMLTGFLDGLRTQNLIDLEDGKIVFPSGLLKLMTDGPAVTDTVERTARRDDVFQRLWTTKLDEGDRELLQKAAALGNSLTIARLEHLCDDEARFSRRLERLIGRGCLAVRPGRGGADMELRFADARLRQRTYQTMATPLRVWYNRRIYDMLRAEAKHSRDRPPVARTRMYSALASHALGAGLWAAAARWSLRAAEAAQSITPGLEVVALCRQAFDAASRAHGETALLQEATWMFADALFHVGSYEEAIPLYEGLKGSDYGDAAVIDERLVRMYLHYQRIDDAQNIAEEMLARAKDDPRARGLALVQWADIQYRRGQAEQAIANGHKALAYFRDAGDEAAGLLAHRRMGLFYWDMGEYGRAIEHTKALTGTRGPVDLHQTLHSLNQLGELYQDIFCTNLALRTHRKALALAQQHGRIALGVEISRNIGLNFVHAGQVDKGLEMLEQTWQQARYLNAEPYRREIQLRSLLEATILAHRPEKVRKLLKQYRQEVGPRETPFIAIFTLALAFLEGRLDEGEGMLAQVQDFWRKTGRRAKAAHALLFVGEEFLLHGDVRRGRTYLDLALEELERICSLVGPDVARHVRASRQYAAAKARRDPPTGRTG